MTLRILFAILILAGLTTCTTGEKNTYALISTDYGDIKVKLYNSKPLHRDNFIKLANEGYYDGTLFHRIIPGFMIQGGDPRSKTEPAGKQLGFGGPNYRIPAEFGALHYRGALAAARTNNPDKESSGSQFYIVHGSPVTDFDLDRVEQRTRIPYSDVQRDLYKEIGGTPKLDHDYSVFGEVVEGYEVIDAIAVLPQDPDIGNRPFQDVKMTVKILN